MKNYSIRISALVSFVFLLNIVLQAQADRKCIEEILLFEDSNNLRNDSTVKNKNIYISYMVKVTDWEDMVTVSNVKIYKDENNMHFFSEQANLIQDQKEVLIVLPSQRILILNSTDKKLNNQRLNQEFFAIRKEFLDSCEVVKCENRDENNKVAVLKIRPEKTSPAIKIRTITYEYNTSEKKITSVTVDYTADYRIKQLYMNYKDMSLASTYSFMPLKSYYMDKKGNVLPKYKDYELVDNRDKKVKSK
jgi:hypothetical protein